MSEGKGFGHHIKTGAQKAGQGMVVIKEGAVSGGKKIITFVLILLILSFVFVYMGPQIAVGAAQHGYQCSGFDCMWRLPVQGAGDLIEGTFTYFNTLGDLFDERMALATGEYWSGRVDDNLDEDLGVTIEFDNINNVQFRESNDVTIWGTVNVNTIDEALDLQMSCYSENGKEVIQGTIEPEELTDIHQFEEESVRCKFESGTIIDDKCAERIDPLPTHLDGGYHDIEFHALFDFTTYSYIKTYFIDREVARAADREQGENYIYQKYNIEKDPISLSTSGPVEIAIGTNTQPLRIDAAGNDRRDLQIGLSIKNSWLTQNTKNKIRSVDELYLLLPEPLTLKDKGAGFDCDMDFGLLPESGKKQFCIDYYEDDTEGCEQQEVTIYKLKTEGIRELENITRSQSINCWVETPDKDHKEDIRTLLGDGVFSTKHINVVTKYTYNLIKTKDDIYVKCTNECDLKEELSDGERRFSLIKGCDSKAGCTTGQCSKYDFDTDTCTEYNSTSIDCQTEEE